MCPRIGFMLVFLSRTQRGLQRLNVTVGNSQAFACFPSQASSASLNISCLSLNAHDHFGRLIDKIEGRFPLSGGWR